MTQMVPDRHLVLTGLVLAALALAPGQALEWQPDALVTGEPWRLITGHWVHLNLTHLALNLGALALMALLWTRFPSAAQWWLFLTFSSLTISLGLLWLTPELPGYRGFSGCLHGLFVLVAMLNLSREPWWSMLILAGISAKLLAEYVLGTAGNMDNLIGGPVVHQAHFLGYLSGLVAGIWVLAVNRKPEQSLPE